MTTHFLNILNFIVDAFIHIWPYLLVTIPLSVAVRMSGASKYINRVFMKKPMLSIFLATVVGAFSPFCSCGVIPIIAALLIGGVPLAPVMSFWIASPSMDPEMFFLSVAMLGWNLAIWRLASTFFLSLFAGYITHFIVQKGWLGSNYVKIGKPVKTVDFWSSVIKPLKSMRGKLSAFVMTFAPNQFTFDELSRTFFGEKINYASASCCSIDQSEEYVVGCCGDSPKSKVSQNNSCGCGSSTATLQEDSFSLLNKSSERKSFMSAHFIEQLFRETVTAAALVLKFMLLAFFLEALIIFYVPQSWIISLLGNQNAFATLWAAILGVPIYTSNMAALPMMGGLLAKGMSPAAVLAFLISGPTTTVPAMAAVWGLTTRKVFALYVLFVLVGAIVFGYVYEFVNALI